MEPLKQWICDTCGELIESPEDGFVEWLSPMEEGVREFRIVHHAPKSPYWEGRGRGRDCYHHTKHPNRRDLHLEDFIGPDGLVLLLSFLDVGDVLDPDFEHPPKVGDMRNFIETFRRLQLPGYEEARRYFREASNSGDFDGANELTPYLQDKMRNIIADHGESDDDE